MCGRFALRAPRRALAEHFGLDRVPQAPARHNIGPGQLVEAVAAEDSGRRCMKLLRWGLVPFWAKDPAMGAKLVNARAETAADKPAFRAALRHRRCLVPADGFYEWQGRAGHKKPWFFSLPDDALFALAGLWESWQGPGGEVLETCTVLTCAADAAVAPVHERMPVILPPESYGRWLNRNVQNARDLEPFFAPFPGLRAWPVGPAVNSRLDGPECSQPLPDGRGIFLT